VTISKLNSIGQCAGRWLRARATIEIAVTAITVEVLS